MTYLRTPKFWLLTTAALGLGAQMPAQAQVAPAYQSNYNYGAPQMIAAAPSLPAIPAEQIARDVQSDFNPRTGRTEFAAQPFDPFEDDPYLAGALTLRSGDGGVAIDGQPLRGGALVEVDFYYNSPSDDPYGGRNYSDASFVNGQLAPVALRETRILECSTRVDNIIYDQVNYYDQSASFSGVYRPTRFYSGHSTFGFGFGSNYFGPGISYYNNNRSNFSRIRRRNNARNVRSNSREDRRDGIVDRAADRIVDRARDRDADSDNRTRSRSRTAQEERNRLRALQLHGSALGFSGQTRTNGRSTLRSERARDRIVIGTGSSQTSTSNTAPASSRADRDARRSQARDTASRFLGGRSSNRQGIAGQVSSRSSATPAQPAVSRGASKKNPVFGTIKSRAADSKSRTSRTSTSKKNTASKKATTSKKSSSSKKAASSKNTSSRASSSKNNSSRASSSRNSSTSRSSTSRTSSTRKSSSSSSSNRSSKNRKRNFFPPNTAGGRHVVTNQSVDCARVDKLRVFVSYDRLDAARYDGLTLIALDAQGGETPIYIPPNYIQGFRLASSGEGQAPSYQPQGYPAQGSATPVPQRRLEAAPCPAGTSPQADGTCLQNRVTGYTIR